jgi:hypothetical protein
MITWTTVPPNRGGFYYWQNSELRSISELAVRLVQVSAYKNRAGFHCETLMPMGDTCPPVFSCDIDKAPAGRWAGPLPDPGVAVMRGLPQSGYTERMEVLFRERDKFKAFAERLAALCAEHGIITEQPNGIYERATMLKGA